MPSHIIAFTQFVVFVMDVAHEMKEKDPSSGDEQLLPWMLLVLLLEAREAGTSEFNIKLIRLA